jgi:hypothetical protein
VMCRGVFVCASGHASPREFSTGPFLSTPAPSKRFGSQPSKWLTPGRQSGPLSGRDRQGTAGSRSRRAGSGCREDHRAREKNSGQKCRTVWAKARPTATTLSRGASAPSHTPGSGPGSVPRSRP